MNGGITKLGEFIYFEFSMCSYGSWIQNSYNNLNEFFHCNEMPTQKKTQISKFIIPLSFIQPII